MARFVITPGNPNPRTPPPTRFPTSDVRSRSASANGRVLLKYLGFSGPGYYGRVNVGRIFGQDR